VRPATPRWLARRWCGSRYLGGRVWLWSEPERRRWGRLAWGDWRCRGLYHDAAKRRYRPVRTAELRQKMMMAGLPVQRKRLARAVQIFLDDRV